MGDNEDSNMNPDTAMRLGVIEGFIAAWNARDRDAIAAAIRSDAKVSGAAYPAVTGPEEAIALSEPFLAADEIDWCITDWAVRGRTVFAQRIDRFRYGAHPWIVIPATGVFEVDDDGMIARWHDYFDAQEIEEFLDKKQDGTLAGEK